MVLATKEQLKTIRNHFARKLLNSFSCFHFVCYAFRVYEELFNELNKWLTVISHHIDTQDSCIVDDANTVHTKMINWIIQALIRLAPDQEELSDEAKKTIYSSTDTVEELNYKANELIKQVVEFTDNITG